MCAVAEVLARGSHLLSRRVPGRSKMYEQGFQTFGATPHAVGGIFGLCYLCHLYKRKLHQQALVAALSVAKVALVHQLKSRV